MKKKVEDYIDLSYSTYVVPDLTTDNEPCYLAYHLELEGCMSHGDTPEEAIRNLREARELYISSLVEMGIEIPTPQGMAIRWDILEIPSPVYADVQTSPTVGQPIFVS